MSLNFAVFRSTLARGERIGAGPVLRAWRSILLFASRWFQIESLYKFNAKFCPVWVPRFFVFAGTKDAPRVAIAALEAEAFLVWPTPGGSPDRAQAWAGPHGPPRAAPPAPGRVRRRRVRAAASLAGPARRPQRQNGTPRRLGQARPGELRTLSIPHDDPADGDLAENEPLTGQLPRPGQPG